MSRFLLCMVLAIDVAFTIGHVSAQESVVKAYLQSAENAIDQNKKAELLRMAMEEAESLKKPELLGGPLLAMGRFELSQGSKDKAKSLFDRAVEVAPTPSGKALMNSLTGNAYRAAGQLSDALPYYKSAVVIREKNDPPGSPRAHVFAQVLKDLANCQRDMGNLTAAEPIYEQAIAVMENRPEKYHLATSLEGLAGLRLLQGNTDEAIKLARKALELYDEDKFFIARGNCLAVLARAKEKSGETEAAIAIFKQAISAYDHKGASELVVLVPVLEDTARLLEASGDGSDAEKFRARAEQIRVRHKLTPSGQPVVPSS